MNSADLCFIIVQNLGQSSTAGQSSSTTGQSSTTDMSSSSSKADPVDNGKECGLFAVMVYLRV